MKTLLLYPIFALLIYIIYRLASLLYYRLYLSKKLENANLEIFKKILGNNYQYKLIHAEAIKYKWLKGWFVVRAVFDANGNLIENDKPHYDYSKFIAAFYFTKTNSQKEPANNNAVQVG